MRHAPRHQSIAWFQEHYKSGRLELRPPFQRKPVWTDKQRSSLIESILLDIPIPEIYVQVSQADDGTEEYGVVDGQQRLRTILQFIGIERPDDREDEEDSNQFALERLPLSSPYKDVTFADLTSEKRKSFFQFEISARYLYTDNRQEVEDVFKRLNKYTLPLKPQELRNATYHGPFAKLSEELADNEYWAVNRIITPAAIRRMGDIEMMSDLLIGLLHGPQGGSSKIIDQYYEEYEEFEYEFPAQARVTRLFNSTLVTIERLFPNISDVPRWGNRADFYSLFVALGNALKDHTIPRNSIKQLSHTLVGFAERVDRHLERPTDGAGISRTYARAIEKGVNDRARRTDRHETLERVIEPFLRHK
jgi:hypothetical protein